MLLASAHTIAAPRTFVSTGGNDASPCSLAQPCRSFGAALAKTNSGGEVIVLDSGGYGPVTIYYPVTITAPPGVYAGITVTSDTGMLVRTAYAGTAVTLRGLTFVQQGGDSAITYESGGRLVLERCTIEGGFNDGIIVTAGFVDMVLDDVRIIGADTALYAYNNGDNGDLRLSVVNSTFSGIKSGIVTYKRLDLLVDNSRLLGTSTGFAVGNGDGLSLHAGNSYFPVDAHVSNSVIRGFFAGVVSYADFPYVHVSIVGSEISHSWVGVQSWGSLGTIALDANRIVHNHQGVAIVPNGAVYTSGTNWFAYDALPDDPLTGPGGVK